MTPQQLIDACRATNQPLPSGRKIADVVERLVKENATLQSALRQICASKHGGRAVQGAMTRSVSQEAS